MYNYIITIQLPFSFLIVNHNSPFSQIMYINLYHIKWLALKGANICNPSLHLLNQPFNGLTTIYIDRKSTRLNSSHSGESRMPSSA